MKVTKDYLKKLIMEQIETIKEGEHDNDPLGGLQNVLSALPEEIHYKNKEQVALLTQAGEKYLAALKAELDKAKEELDKAKESVGL